MGRSGPGSDSWKLHSAAVGGCVGGASCTLSSWVLGVRGAFQLQPECGRSSLAVRPARYVHQTLGELPSDVQQLWANGTAAYPEGRGTKGQPSSPSPPPPGVGSGGAQLLPGGQATTPFQLPQLGHQREKSGAAVRPANQALSGGATCRCRSPVRAERSLDAGGCRREHFLLGTERASSPGQAHTGTHKRTPATETCSDLAEPQPQTPRHTRARSRWRRQLSPGPTQRGSYKQT